VKAKKAVLKSRFCALSDDRIIVIIQEIESWYLAGLDDASQKQLSLRHYTTTNHITKEIFNRMVPSFYKSRIAFMIEILEHFSVAVAKERNRSFMYFCSRFGTKSYPELTGSRGKSLSQERTARGTKVHSEGFVRKYPDEDEIPR
jgi:hypothetical protein